MNKYEVVVVSDGAKYVIQLPCATIAAAIVACEQFYSNFEVIKVERMDSGRLTGKLQPR